MASKYRFKFYRAGGVDQVVLERGADLAHLGELDRKLWAALSMPTKGVHLEARTLELLDTDKDGWVRVAEILGALSWLGDHLVDLGTLLEPGDKLALDKLKDGPLRASARRVLTDLARKDTGTLALARYTGRGTMRIQASVMTPRMPSLPHTSRLGSGPAPEAGSRALCHSPRGVSMRTDCTRSSMCVCRVA